MDMLCAVLVVLLAFCLDYCLGNKKGISRCPMCCVRTLVKKFQRLGYWLISKNKGQEDNAADQKAIGVFCMVIVTAIVACILSLLTKIPFIGYVFFIYFTYLGFNTGSLLKGHKKVFHEVEHSGRGEAQYALARIVDYETTNLDKDSMLTVLAERLAKNVPAAIVAPLFWFMLGLLSSPACALTLLWLYNIVCIAEEVWEPKFGASKVKCVLTYIPAWIAVFLMWLMNFFTQSHYAQGGTWPGFCTIAKQAKSVKDVNGGRSMAALAWLMNAGLWKPIASLQETQERICLGGKECRPWTAKKLLALAKFVRLIAFANVIFLLVLWYIFV